MNTIELLQRATEKYREQLKSYGNGKRKTPEQVYEGIRKWRREEEERILAPYNKRLIEWQKSPFKGGWHTGPITKKSYRPRPRKSKKIKQELEEVWKEFVRKMKRFKRNHPEWRYS